MPGINDYDEAIRLGKVRFKDPTLKTATPVIGRRPIKGGFVEEPWRAPGSFAVAYKMKLPDNRLRAVRCYFSEQTQNAQRYRELHTYLPTHLKEHTVEFRYLDQGIRAESGPTAPVLPVVDMEWVDGRELRQYVADIADHKDTTRLKALGDNWLSLMARMRAAKIAHGDLSGNNIMVRNNGTLVLIDYDGMYVPTLAHVRSAEAGAIEYQHPTARDKRAYGLEMDRFSALLIYVVLRALQERPELWRKHSEYDKDDPTRLSTDRMLFKAEDLANPATSQLFRELSTLTDSLTLRLVEALKKACADDISRTPWVVELADPEFAQKGAMSALDAAVTANDDRAIAAAASDPALASYAAARKHDTRVNTARENLRLLPQLQRALEQNNDDQVVMLWTNMALTATTQPFVARVREAQQRTVVAKDLEKALQADHYPDIERLAKQLEGTQAHEVYQKAIRAAWVRHEQCLALERALSAKNDDTALRIWGLMFKDPKQEKRRIAYESRIVEAKARQAKMAKLTAAITTRDDREIVVAWNEVSGYPSAMQHQGEVDAASARVRVLPQLEEALNQGRVEEAVRLWNLYHFQGRRIVGPIAKQYDEARQQWINKVDPHDISVAIRAGELHVRWTWPESITMVAIALGTTGFAASPRPGDPHCSREEYERHGGFRMSLPPADRYYVRLFALFPEADSWHASPGLQPTASAAISRERTVYYELTSQPDGRPALHVRSGDTSPLPGLVVVARAGSKLLGPSSGQTLARIDEQSPEARLGAITVPLDFSGMGHGAVYVRLFPVEDDLGVRTIGKPSDNIEVAVRQAVTTPMHI